MFSRSAPKTMRARSRRFGETKTASRPSAAKAIAPATSAMTPDVPTSCDHTLLIKELRPHCWFMLTIINVGWDRYRRRPYEATAGVRVSPAYQQLDATYEMSLCSLANQNVRIMDALCGSGKNMGLTGLVRIVVPASRATPTFSNVLHHQDVSMQWYRWDLRWGISLTNDSLQSPTGSAVRNRSPAITSASDAAVRLSKNTDGSPGPGHTSLLGGRWITHSSLPQSIHPGYCRRTADYSPAGLSHIQSLHHESIFDCGIKRVEVFGCNCQRRIL